MYVHHDSKTVWFRCPKTASTATLTAFRRAHGDWDETPMSYGYGTHVPAQLVPEDWAKRYEDYEWISGARHPYTWIPSVYAWLEYTLPVHRILFGGEKWEHKLPESWEQFLEELQITPTGFALNKYKKVGLVYQENPVYIEEKLGIKLVPGVNETSNKRTDFDPEADGINDLIQQKFWVDFEYLEMLKHVDSSKE